MGNIKESVRVLTQSKPRDVLRAAIAEKEKRRRRVQRAASALARGQALLKDAEASLTQLSDVEEAIAAHHAEKVKAWAGSGGKKPSIDIPERLIARRKERDSASEEITAARAACKALSDDVNGAEVRLNQAERNVSEAAVSVISEEADQVATYLEAAKREGWRLASQLRGLGGSLGADRNGSKACAAITAGTGCPIRWGTPVSTIDEAGDEASSCVAFISRRSAR
jgi:hypothetical protein